jgi:hypothetical protein
MRFIRGDRWRNNSGIFMRSDFLNLEFRPLLKTLRFYPKLYFLNFHHKIEILPKLEYFSYSLPLHSEAGYRYGINPYISFGERFGYKLLFNLSSSRYPTSPTKDKNERGVRLEVFANLELPLFFHTFNISRSLNSTVFPSIGADRWEDDISFFYFPKSRYFSLRFGIRRYLNIYGGNLSYQSSALREILSGGEVVLGNFRAYIGGRSEEYVYLSPIMSSESKKIRKYSMGFENLGGNFLLRGEIVALYTFYRFKETENTLNRYLEIEAKYNSNLER